MRKTKHRHRKHKGMLKGKSKFQKIALVFTALLPLVLSFAWLTFIGISSKIPIGYALSPSRNRPLVVGLIIFAVGYIAFLSMMFSEDIKEWYEHLAKHKAHSKSH